MRRRSVMAQALSAAASADGNVPARSSPHGRAQRAPSRKARAVDRRRFSPQDRGMPRSPSTVDFRGGA